MDQGRFRKMNPERNIAMHDRLIAKLNIRHLVGLMRVVENWYDVVAFRIGVKRNFVARMRSGREFAVGSLGSYFAFWKGREMQAALNNVAKIEVNDSGKYIRFSYKGKHICFMKSTNPRVEGGALQLIREQFFKEQYTKLEVYNKDVVDIGASIGDTAIYFALNGARHVYALEPSLYQYETATRNIKLNGLGDRITVLNEGCGGKTHMVHTPTGFKTVACSPLRVSGTGHKIRISSLEDIVGRYSIKDAVMKIDCEGDEYDIILDSSAAVLRKFSQIIIEYHYGYKNLEQRLSGSGFEVRHTWPSQRINMELDYPNCYSGLIFARLKHRK